MKKSASKKRNFLRTAVALAVVAVVGCTAHPSSAVHKPASPVKAGLTDRGTYYADNSVSAESQDSRVKFIILHYTAENDKHSHETLEHSDHVSVHYLVDDQPKMKNGKPVIAQLVPEEGRAWHAGVSNWQGRTSLNDSSIGIEIVNTGFTEHNGKREWYPYPEKQIEAVTLLVKDLIKRYEIEPHRILGHSDIAPLRKEDPGKLFPWQRLAEQGIGAWPDAETVKKYLAGRAPSAPVDIRGLQQILSKYGYDKIPQTGVADLATKTTISAFQMHFRPADISGNADAETEAIAKALVEKYIDKKS